MGHQFYPHIRIFVLRDVSSTFKLTLSLLAAIFLRAENTFANSLDLDQDHNDDGPYLDPKGLALCVSERIFLKRLFLL